MKKKLVALTTGMLLTLAGCSASAAYADPHEAWTKPAVVTINPVTTTKSTLWNLLKSKPTANTMMEKIIAHNQALISNDIKIMAAVKKVKKYAGKTWYVFSGSTPAGWDCSGLVMWTYKQLGVNLEHRASVQARSGKRVSAKNALPGDVVAFYYPGGSSAYHVGIYLGNGKMIDAPRKGVRTTIEPVSSLRLAGSKVKYIRILPRMQQLQPSS